MHGWKTIAHSRKYAAAVVSASASRPGAVTVYAYYVRDRLFPFEKLNKPSSPFFEVLTMAIAETGTESRASASSGAAVQNGGAAVADWIQNLDFDEKQVAQGLGWFSIGLGLAEVATPGLVARIAGTRKRPLLMSLFGMREIAAAAGILTSEDPTPWLWSRVLGDLLDLSAVGIALFTPRKMKLRTLAATVAVAGVTALDMVKSYIICRSSGGGAIAAKVRFLSNGEFPLSDQRYANPIGESSRGGE